MKIAVIGCSHGELDRIYADVLNIEKRDEIVIDLVIICGDFQAVRNQHDLQCMAVPAKYRQLATFHKYYCGESVAPKLTIFIGGNHEASNYLQTLSYGGWVADNIYFMGYANVLRFAGLRIAGISGIYHRNDHSLGHFERLPFDESTKRSAYHTRDVDVYRLLQLRSSDNPSLVDQPIDVFISHDWPLNIHTCGDVDYLLRVKRHFMADVRNSCLGNPLLEPLVKHLRPKYWFSAHLHVKFDALINHTIDGSVQTKFLALDKVLPNRKYLQIIDIPQNETSDKKFLQYDREWLAILKSTNNLLSINRKCSVPSFVSRLHCPQDSDLQSIDNILKDDFKVPENFAMSEPAVNGRDDDSDPERRRNFANPQTTLFCSNLDITDPIAAIIDSLKPIANPDQISLSDDDEDSTETQQKRHKVNEDIDGGGVFFIDRKGNNSEKGDDLNQSATNSENISSDNDQDSHSTEDFIDLTKDDNMESSKTDGTTETSNLVATNANTSSGMTKRALKRRAQKLKRQTELNQLEKLDKMHTNINTNKDDKKLSSLLSNYQNKNMQKKAANARRQLILQRLDWVKSNLPMKNVESEIDVLSLDDLPLNRCDLEKQINSQSNVIQLDD